MGEHKETSPGVTTSIETKKKSKKIILVSLASLITGVVIGSVVVAESTRRSIENDIIAANATLQKTHGGMLQNYEEVKQKNIQLPIDKVVDKQRMSSLFENEKKMFEDLQVAVRPINYYKDPTAVNSMINELNVIVASKLEMLSTIMKYKVKIAEENNAFKSKQDSR